MINKEKIIIRLIEESGLEIPAADFTLRLTQHVIAVHGYKKPGPRYEKIGKAVIVILIGFNILMFFKTNPFQTQPVLCWAAGGFILAFCCIIAWMKKWQAINK